MDIVCTYPGFVNTPVNLGCVSRRAFPLRRARQRFVGSHRDKWVVRCTAQPSWSVDPDREKDEKLFALEERLHDSVFKQDFETAARMRDEITSLQSAAFVDVLQAYMKFYKAFDQLSITDMARVWLQDSNATCKHPVGPLVIGYLEIINSFGSLFSTGMPNIVPQNARISMRGSIAYVTCDEVVEQRAEPSTFATNFQEVSDNFGDSDKRMTMTAVNIFVKRNGEYMLTHHSSSPQGVDGI